MSFPTSVEVESVLEFDALVGVSENRKQDGRCPNTRIPLGLARGYLGNMFWTAEVAGSVGAPERTDRSRIPTRKGPIHLHLQNSRLFSTIVSPASNHKHVQVVARLSS